MSLKFIKFTTTVTVPGPKSAVSFWNAKEDSGHIRAEETANGFELHTGTVKDGQWQPSGMVVRVPWHMVEYVTEQRATNAEKKK